MLPEALPYHLKVRDHFKQHTSTWEFFAAPRIREEQLAVLKTKLLKDCSPFQRETDARLYAQIDLAVERLGLRDLSISAYQAHSVDDPEVTAAIAYLHPEVCLVLTGPIREQLSEPELLSIIAHKLAHVRLYTLLDGDLEVADRIITAVGDHAGTTSLSAGAAAHRETARLFKEYTAIFCDRGALAVVGNSNAVITKNFTRARALQLWQDQGTQADPAIQKLIEGPISLDHLDLFSQASLHSLTRDVLLELLRPEWTRTPMVMSLALAYFPDLSWTGVPETAVAGKLGTILAEADKSVHDYFSYFLLDLTLADPQLGNQLTGRTIAFAGEAGLPWPPIKEYYPHKT